MRVLKYYVQRKHYMRHENKVNEKQYQIIQYTSMATPTFGMYVS